MERYAIVDVDTREVVNSVLWDGVTEWSPEDGQVALLGDYPIGSTVPEEQMPD
jgi:hypothetical protein